MNMITLLEQLANQVHIKNLDLALKDQPLQVKQAFQNNDSRLLKDYLSDSKILPDRTTIFQL